MSGAGRPPAGPTAKATLVEMYTDGRAGPTVDEHLPAENSPVGDPHAGDQQAGDPPVGDPHADDGRVTPNPEVGPIDLDGIERDLAGVEAALARLDDGTYWVDEVTGEQLSDELLAQHPTVRRRSEP